MWPAFRLIDWTLPTLTENLALDEALLDDAERRAESGGEPAPAILRFWEAADFAVVLGASGRIAAEVYQDACRADGVEVARRSSGGGTVVIGPGVANLTVVVPIAADRRFAAVDVAQKAVLGRVADALRAAGAGVTVQGSGDLTLGARKFSGSAQRRLRRTMMVHATILDDFPLGRIDRYLPPPPRQPEYRRGRPHADFLANLGLGRDRIFGAVAREFAAAQADPTERERSAWGEAVARLVREKFADPRWIGRL